MDMITEEMIKEFGDPGLNRIIKAMREAREEFERETVNDQSRANSPVTGHGRPPIAGTHCEGGAGLPKEE